MMEATVPHGTPEAPVPVFFLISLLVAGVALYLVVRRRRTTAAADQVLRDGAP
jgi:formate-dependent nitrite reductase membrane component NrfD